MTPKEQAEELYNVYFKFCNELSHDKNKTSAKLMALACVDEILEVAEKSTEQIKYDDGTYAREYREIPNRYWNEVKQEINKL